MHTLTGLGINYTLIVVVLNQQADLTWVDMQSELVAFESRLKQLTHADSLSVQPVANFVQKDGADSSRGGFEKNNWRGDRWSRGRRTILTIRTPLVTLGLTVSSASVLVTLL